MVDRALADRIVGYAQLGKGKGGETVLEIGAGEGMLTQALADAGAKVIAVEKDPILLKRLKERSGFTGGSITVIGGDALKMEFPRFDKCVSNIPYMISKKLVAKLMRHDFDCIVLTVQKEFAEKLVASPGERDYAAISVLVQVQASVEILETVPKNAFKPQPKVESAVVRIIRGKDMRPIDPGFSDFVARLFQNRKKKVAGLVAAGHAIPRKLGEKRVFQLTPGEFLRLYSFKSK